MSDSSVVGRQLRPSSRSCPRKASIGQRTAPPMPPCSKISTSRRSPAEPSLTLSDLPAQVGAEASDLGPYANEDVEIRRRDIDLRSRNREEIANAALKIPKPDQGVPARGRGAAR